MPVNTPIETLIELSGQLAVLSTPYFGENYRPADTADYAPSQPQALDVMGLWSDGNAQGLATDIIGTFLIAASSLPAGLNPALSTLSLMGVDYAVDRVRTRVYMGEVDGFDLYLRR